MKYELSKKCEIDELKKEIEKLKAEKKELLEFINEIIDALKSLTRQKSYEKLKFEVDEDLGF